MLKTLVLEANFGLLRGALRFTLTKGVQLKLTMYLLGAYSCSVVILVQRKTAFYTGLTQFWNYIRVDIKSNVQY
jgi:hypothetical protein